LGGHAHVGFLLLAVVVAEYADFVVAITPGFQGAVYARRESIVKTFGGSGPLFERAEIGTVGVVVGELGGVAVFAQRLEVAFVELVVDVHPLVYHEGLTLGQALADLCTLFSGEIEIFHSVFLLASWQVLAM